MRLRSLHTFRAFKLTIYTRRQFNILFAHCKSRHITSTYMAVYVISLGLVFGFAALIEFKWT